LSKEILPQPPLSIIWEERRTFSLKPFTKRLGRKRSKKKGQLEAFAETVFSSQELTL